MRVRAVFQAIPVKVIHRLTTIHLSDCSVEHNGILIWTANPIIKFIRKVNLLNGLSTFDCFIDSCLAWNMALRVSVLLMRIELCD